MNKNDINLNNGYYKSPDENFNQALSLFEKKISQSELIEMLQNGNIVQKQIAALKLPTINNFSEALILTQDLTGQDGKIREAVSLKINELLQNPDFMQYFLQEEIYDILLASIIDVNGNVCRNIISAIQNLKNNNDFCEYFIKKLITQTNQLADTVKEFDFQDGKYKVNKEAFKLYWCLEVIFEFIDYINITDLKTILSKTKDINEYTIREKTAKILSVNINDKELNLIKKELKNDKNYYVRRY